jgi:hypothetical protein
VVESEGWKEDREAADRVVISLDLTKERRTRHSAPHGQGCPPSLFNHPGSATSNLETRICALAGPPSFVLQLQMHRRSTALQKKRKIVS